MYDDDEGFEEVMRDETLRCILNEDGAIRCNGECLELALVEERPPPDCSALAEVDWSTLSRGEPIESPEHWGLGYTEEFQLDAAAELLGLDIDEEEFTGPASVREIELDADRGFLTVIELQRGRFALLHGQIALLASRRAIRVGSAPGGLYVSSWPNGAPAVHRLHLSSHELEPILPGRCGN